MAIVARFSSAVEAGQVYDMLQDALILSDSMLEHEFSAAPRLEVVDCRRDLLKLELAFSDTVTPGEYRRLSKAFCQEAEQILLESGETRVRLSP